MPWAARHVSALAQALIRWGLARRGGGGDGVARLIAQAREDALAGASAAGMPAAAH